MLLEVAVLGQVCGTQTLQQRYADRLSCVLMVVLLGTVDITDAYAILDVPQPSRRAFWLLRNIFTDHLPKKLVAQQYLNPGPSSLPVRPVEKGNGELQISHLTFTITHLSNIYSCFLRACLFICAGNATEN